MISRLIGVLAAKRAPLVLIDCHGVGYEAEVSMTTFYRLPEVGQQVALWTHLLVKEDAHSLVGFHDEQERRLFRQLIRINGVGPKLALTILSGIEERQFALCVSAGDVAMLTRLPGVGKKTAERLIIEMRDKIDIGDGDAAPVTVAGAAPSVAGEAVEALLALGYKAADADRMINRAREQGADDDASQLIRRALQATVKP